MKRILSVLLCACMLAILSGCGPKIEGKWSASSNRMEMTWEFKPKGELAISAMGRTQKGSWAMKDDKLTLTFNGSPIEMPAKLDKDTLTISIPNSMTALQLKRVKE